MDEQVADEDAEHEFHQHRVEQKAVVAERAFDANAAAVKLDEALAEREAKAGGFCLARRVIADLAERFE